MECLDEMSESKTKQTQLVKKLVSKLDDIELLAIMQIAGYLAAGTPAEMAIAAGDEVLIANGRAPLGNYLASEAKP